MDLARDLLDKGFLLAGVTDEDFPLYYEVKKACYQGYVEEYYGGWDEETQRRMNQSAFEDTSQETCFLKVLWNGEVVGFLAYDELDDRIDGISVQILEKTRNMGLGSCYLHHIVSLADQQRKPVFLKVFRSNPAKNLYERFGFAVYDETPSHCLMKYEFQSIKLKNAST